jgi:hypothetical protein
MELEQFALEVYGVRAVVATNSTRLIDELEGLLPPGWARCEATETDKRFVVTTRDGAYFRVEHADGVITEAAELELALDVLDSNLRAHIALQAPDKVFVHAGVVAHGGRAIAIPGASFSGKTTLVTALVRAGATYYSDEYAVLDEDGYVHPYAKRLSIRDENYAVTEHHVASLGGVSGEQRIRLGLVAVTHYRPGGRWEPRRLSSGESTLALLANTVPAQTRPAQALEAIGRAIDGAIVLEGDRGEADEIVDELLASVSSPA